MSPARFVALVVCSVLAAIAMVGCAPTSAYVSAREFETVAASFVDTSADTWHAYSHAQLENYKNGCGDLDCFKTVVAQWESGTVGPVDKAITAAKQAVQAFDAALNADKAVKQSDFSTAIQQLTTAIEQLTAILSGYGVNLTPFKAVTK